MNMQDYINAAKLAVSTADLKAVAHQFEKLASSEGAQRTAIVALVEADPDRMYSLANFCLEYIQTCHPDCLKYTTLEEKLASHLSKASDLGDV